MELHPTRLDQFFAPWVRIGLILCCVLLVSFALTRIMSRLETAAVAVMERRDDKLMTVRSTEKSCGGCHAAAVSSRQLSDY